MRIRYKSLFCVVSLLERKYAYLIMNPDGEPILDQARSPQTKRVAVDYPTVEITPLSHELTRVVQQDGFPVRSQAKLTLGSPDDAGAQDVSSIAGRFERGTGVTMVENFPGRKGGKK